MISFSDNSLSVKKAISLLLLCEVAYMLIGNQWLRQESKLPSDSSHLKVVSIDRKLAPKAPSTKAPTSTKLKSTKAPTNTTAAPKETKAPASTKAPSLKATTSAKAAKVRRLTEIAFANVPNDMDVIVGEVLHDLRPFHYPMESADLDVGELVPKVPNFNGFIPKVGDIAQRGNELISEQVTPPRIEVGENGDQPGQDDGDDGAEGELEDPSPCNHVDPGMPNNLEFQTKCRDYLAEPYIQPDCTNKTEIVPRIYHSVSATNSQFYHQLATAGQNPTFQRNHLGNDQARDYIEEKCGPEAAQAYDCLEPPAYRADLFRFCALSAEGGVYLDQDILPFVPLEELYSPCSVATVGHDFPWNDIKGKQMKILAGAPGAPIFQCAVERIVRSVKDRYYPSSELALTGPQMLEGCYQENSSNVAITYHDTRNAAWPYTGMRAGQKILAYEIPISGKHFWQEGGEDENDYTNLFQTRRVYKDSCTLQT